MHQIFQNFIDSLAESSDEQALRLTMEVAAAALDLACFAYLAQRAAARGSFRIIRHNGQRTTSKATTSA
jgi:LuxR family transcriptional regulator, activator of conjugal transfer of Ti plasmids